MSQSVSFEHEDALVALNGNLSLHEKLKVIHETVRARFGVIDRVAVALYDAQSESLRTFLHSSNGAMPLIHYETRLAEAPSLVEVIQRGRPRVVQDLAVFENGEHEHTKKIAGQGHHSSYTVPMYQSSELFGFIFFNSRQQRAFNAAMLVELDLFARIISMTIVAEMMSVRTLLAAVQAARHVTDYRDAETGAHINRTAHYARLITKQLAPKYQLSDEFIENVYRFSPLHDIGKISVPDHILRKPAKLTGDEYAVMKTHTTKGREIIDTMLSDFGINALYKAGVLRNIALYHHEAVDGTGYPEGLKGDEIPLEARISAVADVFDALTSRRPYKEPWTNDDAINALRSLAGTKLDAECVEALVTNLPEISRIQSQFADDIASAAAAVLSDSSRNT